MPVRVFTSVIQPSAPMAIGITMTMTFGGVPKVFNSGVLAFPVLPAKKMAWLIFVAKANAVLRQWILSTAAILGITTVPSLANVLLKFRFPTSLTPSANANQLSITFDPTGFAIGINPAVLVSFSLDNTSGWATALGMVRDTLLSKVGIVAVNVATVLGEQQPSYFFVFERSDQDLGDEEVMPSFHARYLRDGTIRTHVFGSSHVERVIKLLDHEDPMLGGPLGVSTFASIDASRSVLTLNTTNEAGLVGPSGLYQNEDAFVVGSYYRVGLSRWVSRIESKSGGPPATSAVLFEKAPTSATPGMADGQTLYRVSEFDALMRRVIDGGYLFVHAPDDFTGQTRWKSEPYALNYQGEAKPYPRRVGNFFDLWSVELPLVRRDNPELLT